MKFSNMKLRYMRYMRYMWRRNSFLFILGDDSISAHSPSSGFADVEVRAEAKEGEELGLDMAIAEGAEPSTKVLLALSCPR